MEERNTKEKIANDSFGLNTSGVPYSDSDFYVNAGDYSDNATDHSDNAVRADGSLNVPTFSPNAAIIDEADINTFYYRIDNIRKKYNLNALPQISVKEKDKINSQNFKEIKNRMEQTTRDATYITNKTYNFGNLEVGDLILRSSYEKIHAELETLEGLCNNCVNKSDNSICSHRGADDSDYTVCSNNSVRSVRTNNSDNSGDEAFYCTHDFSGNNPTDNKSFNCGYDKSHNMDERLCGKQTDYSKYSDY